jgi:hypothetical protein
MKIRLVLACAISGLAVLGFGATNAVAEGANGTLQVNDGTVFESDLAVLDGTCDDPAFTSPAPVTSDVLNPVELTGEKDENGVWQLHAVTSAPPDVRTGPATASFTCGDQTVVAKFQVISKDTPHMALGLDPGMAEAGQDVRISATCLDPRFVSSKITSPILTAPDVVRREGDPVNGPLESVGKVAADAKPGTYPVSFVCLDVSVTEQLIIVADDKAPTAVQAAAKPGSKPQAKAQVPVKPKGAADTGSLDEVATQTTDDGPGALAFGAGAAALLAAGGAGVWAHRRRQNA